MSGDGSRRDPDEGPRWAHRTPRRGSEADEARFRSQPERLDRTLDQLVRQLGWGPRSASVGVIGEWERIVGPAIAAHAQAVSSDGTTLMVVVDDPAWATQLRWLERDLLDRLASDAGVRFERLAIRVRPR